MNDETLRVVIVSGLSGSGKTTAVQALEDDGFFCIDNLPAVLVDRFLVLCRDHPEIRKVAVVIDIRNRAFVSSFEEAITRAVAEGFEPEIVFLTCDDQVLARRFSETRRMHPMSQDGEDVDIRASVRRERETLAPILDHAHSVIDTSQLSTQGLKEEVHALVDDHASSMRCRVMSFGFKNGVPSEADYVFDVRFLPNPFYIEELRPKSGLDPEIGAYLRRETAVEELLDRLQALLALVLPAHKTEGRQRLTLAIGCTGGRHRSVFVAERIAERIAAMLSEGPAAAGTSSVRTFHRDLKRDLERKPLPKAESTHRSKRTDASETGDGAAPEKKDAPS
jgi:RNase adapter protein RapZ